MVTESDTNRYSHLPGPHRTVEHGLVETVRPAQRCGDGVVNSVWQTLDGLSVFKVARASDPPLYRSPERESAAIELLAMSARCWAPKLLAEGPGWMQLSRQPGVPLHRALAGQSSRYRRLIISNAGLTLNEVHAHIPPSGSELDLPYAGEGWWERIHTGLESMGRVIVADNRALTDVVLTVLGRTVNLARSLDEPAHSLVHGDFGGANILVSPGGSISGVLDWEWAVRGDPNLDVARALWLPHVGRSSRLWETASERKLFLDSHSAGDRRRISTEAWFIYSVWFTFSFLTFCIATGADRRRYCAVWSNLLSFAHGNKGFGSGGDGPSARQLTRRQ